MNTYFPELKNFGRKVKVWLDLSNYATKGDFKNVAGVNLSKFARKVNILASLNSNLDQLDYDKLKNTPSNINYFKFKVYQLYA